MYAYACSHSEAPTIHSPFLLRHPGGSPPSNLASGIGVENRRNRSGKWIFVVWIFCELGKSLRKKQPHFMKVHQISTTEVPMEGNAGWRWGGSCCRLNVNTSGQLQINLVHGKQKWQPKRLQNLIHVNSDCQIHNS